MTKTMSVPCRAFSNACLLSLAACCMGASKLLLFGHSKDPHMLHFKHS